MLAGNVSVNHKPAVWFSHQEVEVMVLLPADIAAKRRPQFKSHRWMFLRTPVDISVHSCGQTVTLIIFMCLNLSRTETQRCLSSSVYSVERVERIINWLLFKIGMLLCTLISEIIWRECTDLKQTDVYREQGVNLSLSGWRRRWPDVRWWYDLMFLFHIVW